MAKFISKKEEKYNADDIANQLISQINNNEVDSSKIKTEEINIRSDKNDYNENNNVSLWDKVKNIANGFGKNIQNAGLGIDNGISYFRQQLERNTRNNTFNSAVNMNDDFLQEQLNKKTNNESAKSILEENNKYIDKIKNEQNDYQNKLQEKINNNNQKISKNIEDINNPILKKTAQLAPSIGQMIPSFIPGFGAVYASGSASGQYYEDAKQRGMNDEEAQKYSGIMGLMEGASEMIGIENLSKAGKGVKALVKGTGKEIVKEGTKELTKSSMKTVLKNYGIGIADNIIQEAIIDPIQELTAQTVAGKDKAQWEGIGQKMLQDGINGGLVSAILGGANLGIQSCTGVVEKLHSNQKITGQEIQNAVKEAGQQLDASKMMLDSVEQQVNKYKDYYTGKELDSNTQDVLKQAQNIINNNQNSQQNPTQNQFNSQEQQIIPTKNKNAPDSNIVENSTKIKGYHGTDENFDNFDLKYFGKHDQGDFGKAVYFSDNENTASKYGKNVKQQDIELNNPYIINTEEDYKQLWSQLAKETDISKLDKTELKLLKDPYTSQEEKNFMLYDKLNSEEKANAIQKLGYDGVIDNTYGQIAVFSTDKINNIANNQEILYNNAKESESGSNESIRLGGMLESNRELSRVYEEAQQPKQYTRTEYEKWEKSIKPIKYNELTSAEQKISNYVQGQYNKVLSFFDGNENDLYYGGASYSDKNKIYIDRNQAKNFGTEKMVYHETLESDILHNNDLSKDVIKPSIQKIIEDPNFEKQKQEFWKSETGKMPSDYLIAKDILCDRFSELKTGKKVDYNNVLSQETNMTIDFSLDNFHKKLYGKEIKDNPSNLPTKENTKTELNLPTKENINTQGETINWNEIERPEGKIRKHYKSIIESSNTTKEAKTIAKELMGTDTYVPETNKSQLAQADTRINNSSPESELKSLMNRATTGGKIEAVDIAVGERLIQYYSKVGDKTNLQEAIQATAMAGTNAGQTVQALSMLNHQTPEGQATWIQRSVDKMNNELAKKKGGTITKDSEGNIKVINKLGKDITDKVDLFDLTPEMIEKITSSKDKETMYKNIDSVYEELGEQVPKSTIEKIDSWRYFSMLANPRTHIRNMVGNVAMGKTQRVKDKLAGGIEDIVSKFNPDMERTKTIAFSDKKTKEFAKNDFNNIEVQSRLELNENKYNPQSRLQNARKTFKSDILEKTLGKLFDLNDNLLEAEDGLGLKSAYQKALSDYITANKINVDNITDSQLGKARNYAVQQAKEATFHQANSIASAINQFSRKNKLTKGATDAILPFVKTPMNVAKAGLEYNPVGLLKTITTDTVKLRKGNISVNKYIDNLSKGLTGTGIAVLGYALADAGLLKASGSDDDKKENYDEATGKQSYSIQIAGKTYSLDWLAPAGIPLFTGAEAYSIKNSNQNEKSSVSSDDNKKTNQILNSLENWANGMAKSISPMSEMSMISGLTSALSSYSEDKLSAMGTNAVKSYVNQFVPTLLGQVAKTADDYERSTKSTKTGLLQKSVDQTKLQMMSKIPGLRQKLPTKADIWGNELKQSTNLPIRAFNNFINPATTKEVTQNDVDKEINSLYEKNGNKSIIPESSIDKTFTINGNVYRMTNEEYSKYKTQYAKNSYNLINNLISSKEYNSLEDTQKEKAIENIYAYVKEQNKVEYSKSVNQEFKTSTLYNTLENLKKQGGEQSDYLNYIAKVDGVVKDKEKEKILADSNYSDTTKSIIYKTAINSRDKKVLALEKINFPITQYLNYKAQEFVSDKDEDGESISGTKKKKVYNYLNNISSSKLSDINKKIICKIEGISNYDKDIVNYINKQNISKEDKTDLLKNIGFKVDKEGYIKTTTMLPITKNIK